MSFTSRFATIGEPSTRFVEERVNGPRKLIVAAMFVILVAAFSSASDIYIAQNASGADTGADCADAYPFSWFNTSSNWGSGAGKIGPGTTVHMCGTFTGTAGQQLLTFQGSGSSGNPITLKFETGAVMNAPYWGGAWTNPSAGIVSNGKSWIVIDGGTNGTIENTENGTGLTYSAQDSTAVEVIGGSNNVVKNLTIRNMCVRSAGDPGNGGQSCEVSVDIAGIVIEATSNTLVQYNTISDAHNCIYYSNGNGDSNNSIQYNTLSRCNWEIGINGGGTATGINIIGNDISCVVGGVCNWDDPIDANHHNGIMLDPQSGNTLSGVTIANNYFHDINGNTTSYIFHDSGGTGSINCLSELIYNNIFFTTATQTGPANQMITGGCGIYNNTFLGPGAAQIGVGANATVQNNIMSSPGTSKTVVSTCGTGCTGNTLAYNLYYNVGAGWTNNAGSFWSTLASWQSASAPFCSGGCDVASSLVGNPVLNSDFTLGSGSAAVGVGKNLTYLGIAGLDVSAPQYFGSKYACGNGCLPRPSTGAWDIGAYQSSSSSAGQPAPPSGLIAQVQ
jgi:hypothetical protein